jgi:hypothetical protein
MVQDICSYIAETTASYPITISIYIHRMCKAKKKD